MNSLIAFYSYSGNTGKVANILAEYLEVKGRVEVVEVKCLDESTNFFMQAARAFKREKGKIAASNFNLSKYDTICFGTPVWAFGPAPAMNAYLDSCFGVEGKAVILFTTHGSGAGVNNCIDYMKEVLLKKGAKSFKVFTVQQSKVKEKSFVFLQIDEAR